jgi:hypothetical protein
MATTSEINIMDKPIPEKRNNNGVSHAYVIEERYLV